MGKFDFMAMLEVLLAVFIAMVIFQLVKDKLPSLEAGNLENTEYADEYADYYEQ
jgi:hypothetical protein